jgi:hypothetical protein
MEGQIFVDTKEIREYIIAKLIERGIVPPNEEDIIELADIVFDYLLDKGIMKEEPNE